MKGLQTHKTEPVKASKPHIVVKLQVPIDEEHPTVIKLLDLDYSLEQSIQAAEHFPEDAVAAQKYLTDLEYEKQHSNGVQIQTSTLHADTEIQSEKPAFEQQESNESTCYDERYVV